MSKFEMFVVETILPEDAVLVTDPKLEPPGKCAFRSPTTHELFWWPRKRVACYIFHTAEHFFNCEICHPYLKPVEESNNVG